LDPEINIIFCLAISLREALRADGIINSCTTPGKGGWAPGNIANAPMFVDINAANYRLSGW